MTIMIVGNATVYNFVGGGIVSEEPGAIHIQGINISLFLLPFLTMPVIIQFHVFSIANMDAVLLKAQNGTQVPVLRSKECKCAYKLHYEA
jgi:hypothetical protein